jgi:hypothetical protein
MKVYLNNEYIGEVLGRYSMSILPIVLRVRTFDITNKIKQGKNIIAIEAYNYDKYKGAINLYGQIRLNDSNVQEIITDNTWIHLYNKIDDRINWKDMNYIDKEWKKAHSYGRPPKLNGDIFKPDLLNGEKSETQDFFSIESYFSNFTDEYDEKALNHMINIFNPYGN